MQKRRITRRVQLIMQSNDCCLLPYQPTREIFQKSKGAAGDIGPEPNREIFLERSGNGKYFVHPAYSLKQEIRYIQKIKVDYITKKGLSYNHKFHFPERLYLDFVRIEKKKDFRNFVEVSNFCIFPEERELKGLREKYREALLGNEVEHIAANYKLDKDLEKRVARNQEIIRKINLDFLWEKQRILKNLVVNFEKKKMIQHDFLWINDQNEYISEILIDPQHLGLKESESGFKISDDEKVNFDIYKEKRLWKTFFVPGLRIYGHFALCCLEFFLDIKDEIAMTVCDNCGLILGFTHGKKENCGPENPDCYFDRLAKERQKQRSNEKKLKTD